MDNEKLTETVTIEREVTGVIKDLVMFARYLEERTGSNGTKMMPNAKLIELANDFWEREHGDEHG